MTVNLEKHAEAILRPVGLSLDELRYTSDRAATLAACQALADDARKEGFEAGALAMREAATEQAVPSTAENPNESAYERGRFDGILQYGLAIRAIDPASLRGEK